MIRPIRTLTTINEEWEGCTKCEIGCEAKNHVFTDHYTRGYFTLECDILFIGEGPGLQEDRKGMPFVGPAGQLLREAISDANPRCPECLGTGMLHIGPGWDMAGQDYRVCEHCNGEGQIRIVFTNLIACRPYDGKPHEGKNREPSYTEVMNCMPRLIDTIRVLNPRYLIFLGREPESYIGWIKSCLSGYGESFGMYTLQHPSFILRRGGLENNPSYVKEMQRYFEIYWKDVAQMHDPFAEEPNNTVYL